MIFHFSVYAAQWQSQLSYKRSRDDQIPPCRKTQTSHISLPWINTFFPLEKYQFPSVKWASDPDLPAPLNMLSPFFTVCAGSKNTMCRIKSRKMWNVKLRQSVLFKWTRSISTKSQFKVRKKKNVFSCHATWTELTKGRNKSCRGNKAEIPSMAGSLSPHPLLSAGSQHTRLNSCC